MKEVYGNMLNHKPSALVVTTNGFVKRNGECVMGRGIAKQIAERYPSVPRELGDLINKNGNVVQVVHHDPLTDMDIIAFPVKPVKRIITKKEQLVRHMRDKHTLGLSAAGWMCVAEPEIIRDSLEQLEKLTNEKEYTHVLCPRFGCGAGELEWSSIRPLAEQFLDNRFYVMTFPPRS